jgi:hypothetical protein
MDHDADAIFTAMLVELHMDMSRIFTLTELTNESNSKFLRFPSSSAASSTSRHFAISPVPTLSSPSVSPLSLFHRDKDQDEDDDVWSTLWHTCLQTGPPVNAAFSQDGTSLSSIYSMPLYMSGRLLHPQLCENLLVQSFYNQNIHRVIRQLVGGSRSTGIICARRVACPAVTVYIYIYIYLYVRPMLYRYISCPANAFDDRWTICRMQRKLCLYICIYIYIENRKDLLNAIAYIYIEINHLASRIRSVRYISILSFSHLKHIHCRPCVN